MKHIEDAIKLIAAGKFVIVTDDEDRENEGDLILAAEKATPEAIAFMVRHSTGILCVPMTSERLEELQIPLMVDKNTEMNRTAFTISVDYFHGTTTGVSAADRTATILALIDPKSNPTDFRRPGHIFPLKYCEGGVLKRAGHTEACVDLARLAGLVPAGVIGELVNDDGSMSRMADLKKFAAEHQIPIITIADLIKYRNCKEKLVECVSQARIPTKYGEFTSYVFQSNLDQVEHIALVKGSVKNKPNILVRVHSECLTGDVFGSQRCDCGTQLDESLKLIAEAEEGVVVYLRGHEGRGIGLGHKVRAYELQDQGRDTVDANIELGLPVDSRQYGIGAQILQELGITTLRLLTNNPSKYGGLAGYNLKIVERVPLQSILTKDNYRYLNTKKEKLGHLLEFDPLEITKCCED